MTHDWKRLDRHGLSSDPGQPVLMSSTVDKLDEYADRIAELETKLAKAVDALSALEKAASEVSRRGAETGPQWTKLTCAIIPARATLAELTGGNDE